MQTKQEAYERGLELLKKLHGGHAGEALMKDVSDICPDFAAMTLEWALAGVMARPHLDLLTRQFVVISACVTLGHASPQLAAHLQAALSLGATKEQLVEVILQNLFYAGGAATANALRVAKQVLGSSEQAPA